MAFPNWIKRLNGWLERYPLYRRYCDLKLDNDDTIETAAERVKEAFHAHFGA